MRVLVVEDEERLRSQLQKRLVSEGYSVDVAADGEEGLYFAEEYPFDVAVIDLGLPKLSGIELIGRLRRQQISFPILILTARDNWQDKVAGLEVGGDDYLVKPFNMEELLARLNALLRRSVGYASPQITWGPITLNTARQQALLADKEVVLTAYEYKVLEYLMLHAGKVISKTELTEHIYDQDFDRDSNVLEVFIRRLRRKFDPQGELKPIETLRGRGYRFSLQQPPT